MTTVSPYTWDMFDVEGWGAKVKLSESVIKALLENEVDGPTLMTIAKTDLREELGISSLPGRRYLWECIEILRAEQGTVDHLAAVQTYEEEISRFASDAGETADDGAGAVNAYFDPVVVECLQSDAKRQRQIVADHLLALRFQSEIGTGQGIYEDAELALEEQCRFDQNLMQSEYDREIALSFADQADVPERARQDHELQSLFNLAIHSCVENKVNVAKAFETGKIKPIHHRRIPDDPDLINDDEYDNIRKGIASSKNFGGLNTKDLLSELPNLRRCDVCFEEKIPGFFFPCNHNQCVSCMRGQFRAALNDTSLLPLRCCNIPLDMSFANALLKPDEFERLSIKLTELSSKKIMYCPSCGCFINLELIDNSLSLDFTCACGTSICTNCRTASHLSLTCAENKEARTGSNDLLLGLAARKGWKQCPSCAMMIELVTGCNHMTCKYCRHQFCYKCLRPWATGGGVCSSGQCEFWDETLLVRVEARRGR